MYVKDTIVAQSTPQGISGVAILRISGNKIKKICKKMLGFVPKIRYANYSSFLNIRDKSVIDKGIVIRYKSPSSFTGEDVLEIQCHGNPIIIDMLIKNILLINEVRIAEPGEFTKRAFFNNKIDLLQAEGIDDLIHANSKVSVKSYFNSAYGIYSIYISKLSSKISSIRTDIEAILNFEYKYDNNIKKIFLKKIDKIIYDFKKVLEKLKKSYIFKEGINVAIVGKPNSGKSSLFNSIISDDRSIVTKIPGTTRDILKEFFFFDGLSFNVSDTAGIRESNNKIEKIGVLKTWKELDNSNYALLVIDSSDLNYKNSNTNNKIIKHFKFKNIPYSIVLNKCDILNLKPNIEILKNVHYITLSAKKNVGINMLLKFLKDQLLFKNFNRNGFLSKRRHLNLIQKSLCKLISSKKDFLKFNNIEILAQDINDAQKFLDYIVGKVYTNDLLDSIFSNFCIGK
ncbi:tRNA uridine-5-carboxymethylaminomethyl(34) synthesis GTPase MnmE [Buchnera aphidicola (Ceratoglyphina bambusae)]|uniref:tRNA uridine-5-carboxymethylaminomethyl(34) synthesis GTPase MnmE n=1 Tax=Buchnera aphidicola TaxID=9 RepID=UPI0031B87FB0